VTSIRDWCPDCNETGWACKCRTREPLPKAPVASQGCVCPVGAEAICQGPLCPRKKWIVT
jgi:hypothetical protein